ncbi:hypothetical protein CQY20_22430 [Mycolicibacterium agri]|nr:hypothetical protein CQY20_22430 [Mycolicibacterium agri]
MGRHGAMASSAEDPKPAKPAGTARHGADSQRHVLAPFHHDVDEERYRVLTDLAIRGVDPRYVGPALESAKRLWCRLRGFALSTDRISAAHLARYLAFEAERVGTFDYRTALRRANVDRYLMDVAMRRTNRSMRTIRWILYDAGRLVHPREYPEARTLPAPRTKRIAAASAQDIRDWYALAPTLPQWLRRRLMLLLDLCYGAGARPPDFKVLRGTSITSETIDGRELAIVRLRNTAGGTRLVPVTDSDISRRLLDLAHSKGSDYLLPAAKGQVERNATDRIGEQLRARSHGNINAAALRNRWILDLAERVPAALLLQLADVVDVQVLADQRDQLPTYGLHRAIALMTES